MLCDYVGDLELLAGDTHTLASSLSAADAEHVLSTAALATAQWRMHCHNPDKLQVALQLLHAHLASQMVIYSLRLSATKCFWCTES